jgi:hypothetical protein
MGAERPFSHAGTLRPSLLTRTGRIAGLATENEENAMKHLAMLFLTGFVTVPVTAQTASAGQSAGPAWSPAKSIGMFAYPKNHQNSDQQLKDESECYGSAKQNSGVDPQGPIGGK